MPGRPAKRVLEQEHLTLDCSWRAGWYLAWQPIAIGVWMCVNGWMRGINCTALWIKALYKCSPFTIRELQQSGRDSTISWNRRGERGGFGRFCIGRICMTGLLWDSFHWGLASVGCTQGNGEMDKWRKGEVGAGITWAEDIPPGAMWG